jgi:predicted dehydrogenase
MQRRHFLASSAVAGIAASAASGKIRTGILGIQHSHLSGKLQAMAASGAYEVVAVAEPDDTTRERMARYKMFDGLKWFTADQMLSDKSLDLIVFEGEVKDAVPFGKRALDAGKHLHLEKPPTNRLEPFRELVDLAKRRDRKLQLGYLYRYHPAMDTALEAFHKGWLGEVYMVRTTMNSDRDTKQRGVEARYPGGSMFELGGHVIDRVIAFLGRPKEVRQYLRHDTSISDTLKDNTLAVFEYPKALATVVSSARDAASHRSFEVIGTDGSVLIDPIEPASVVKIQLREARGPYKKGTQEVRFPPQPRFVRDMDELAKAILGNKPLRYSWDHELLLQETLLRASGEIA